MTGQVANTLTCAALTLAVSGWARAQEPPAALAPPTFTANQET